MRKKSSKSKSKTSKFVQKWENTAIGFKTRKTIIRLSILSVAFYIAIKIKTHHQKRKSSNEVPPLKVNPDIIVARPPPQQPNGKNPRDQEQLTEIIHEGAIPKISIQTRTGGLSEKLKHQVEENPNSSLPKRYEANFDTKSFLADRLQIKISPLLICQQDLLVLIKSRPASSGQRRAIRETYGEGRQILFLIGMEEPDEKILKEAKNQNDLLVFNFEDSYENLTTKMFATINYAIEKAVDTCQVDNYIFTDDDVFLDIPKALQNLSNSGMTCLCKFLDHDVAKATRQGKWGVSYDQWSSDSYPAYCEGAGYAFSRDTLVKIYELAKSTNIEFPIDDIYFTGILRQKAGINIAKNEHSWEICKHLDNANGSKSVIQKFYELAGKEVDNEFHEI